MPLLTPSITVYVKEPIEAQNNAQEANLSLSEPSTAHLTEEQQRIIWCESRNNPNAINHNKKNGEVWSTDHSYWQINDYYHKDQALSMGLDITNPKDNMEYGLWLYETEGNRHWQASRWCWKQA